MSYEPTEKEISVLQDQEQQAQLKLRKELTPDQMTRVNELVNLNIELEKYCNR